MKCEIFCFGNPEISGNMDIKCDHNEEILSFSSSTKHSVLILSNNYVYVFGNNSKYQLGTNKYDNYSKFEREIYSHEFIEAQCGNDFTIWKDSRKKFYISGYDTYKTQTLMPFDCQMLSVYGNTLAILIDSINIRLYTDFPRSYEFISCILPDKPLQISAGESFVSILINGSLFLMNKSGNLLRIPPYIANIVSISSTHTYTLALDSDHTLHMHGDLPDHPRQYQNPISQDVISFKAFKNHCIFQKSNLQLWLYGQNHITNRLALRPVLLEIDHLIEAYTSSDTYTLLYSSHNLSKVLPKTNLEELSYQLDSQIDLFT